ncbi:uncharacterized protein ASCRUDRAFT_10181 [Ascoidea rubescens DSM 1968]|uniref:Uncharacterized protein n=1 Tax=Ascoidea rubescens DSM 1968 TaxID=1344418 RepID=A0A1D2VAH4_9ASCO|nr:hypothetical protein ASCRUDRAFT_10181 [Ascoidea rubescens DSM 1968]ODV58599.1 hypothetical protein ASCRUDRAFT_10181 [Ascoidea rubescens DSM 1968]
MASSISSHYYSSVSVKPLSYNINDNDLTLTLESDDENINYSSISTLNRNNTNFNNNNNNNDNNKNKIFNLKRRITKMNNRNKISNNNNTTASTTTTTTTSTNSISSNDIKNNLDNVDNDDSLYNSDPILALITSDKIIPSSLQNVVQNLPLSDKPLIKYINKAFNCYQDLINLNNFSTSWEFKFLEKISDLNFSSFPIPIPKENQNLNSNPNPNSNSSSSSEFYLKIAKLIINKSLEIHQYIYELNPNINEINKILSSFTAQQFISDAGCILTELSLKIIKLKNELHDKINIVYSKSKLLIINSDLEDLLKNCNDSSLSNVDSQSFKITKDLESTLLSYKTFVSTLLSQLNLAIENNNDTEIDETLQVISDLEKMFLAVKQKLNHGFDEDDEGYLSSASIRSTKSNFSRKSTASSFNMERRPTNNINNINNNLNRTFYNNQHLSSNTSSNIPPITLENITTTTTDNNNKNIKKENQKHEILNPLPKPQFTTSFASSSTPENISNESIQQNIPQATSTPPPNVPVKLNFEEPFIKSVETTRSSSSSTNFENDTLYEPLGDNEGMETSIINIKKLQSLHTASGSAYVFTPGSHRSSFSSGSTSMTLVNHHAGNTGKKKSTISSEMPYLLNAFDNARQVEHDLIDIIEEANLGNSILGNRKNHKVLRKSSIGQLNNNNNKNKSNSFSLNYTLNKNDQDKKEIMEDDGHLLEYAGNKVGNTSKLFARTNFIKSLTPRPFVQKPIIAGVSNSSNLTSLSNPLIVKTEVINGNKVGGGLLSKFNLLSPSTSKNNLSQYSTPKVRKTIDNRTFSSRRGSMRSLSGNELGLVTMASKNSVLGSPLTLDADFKQRNLLMGIESDNENSENSEDEDSDSNSDSEEADDEESFDEDISENDDFEELANEID